MSDPLDRHRKDVAAAELALERARKAMLAAAEREGIRINGLFADSSFISRSTGKSWREEGYEEGERRGFSKGQEDGIKLGLRLMQPDPHSPWSHLKNLKLPRPAK